MGKINFNYEDLRRKEKAVWDQAAEQFEAENVAGMIWSEGQNAYLSPRLSHMEDQLFHGRGDREEFEEEMAKAQEAFDDAGDTDEYYDGDAYLESRQYYCRDKVREFRQGR